MTGSHLLRGSYLLDVFADNIPNLTDYVCISTLTNRRRNIMVNLLRLLSSVGALARSTPSLRRSLNAVPGVNMRFWVWSSCFHSDHRSCSDRFCPDQFSDSIFWTNISVSGLFFGGRFSKQCTFSKNRFCVLYVSAHKRYMYISVIHNIWRLQKLWSSSILILLFYNVATVQMFSPILPKNWQSPGHLQVVLSSFHSQLVPYCKESLIAS